MPLDPDEYDEMCRQTCPQCASGNVPRFRPETKEWVHDSGGRGSFSHTFCLATGLRKVYEASNNGK
jgi:hypothetical protein